MFQICQDGNPVGDAILEIVQFSEFRDNNTTWVGNGTLTVCPALPDGDYSIYAKEWHCLSKVATFTVAGGAVVDPPVEFPLQENGDCDDSNLIDLTDFGTLAAFFFQSYERDCTFRSAPIDPNEPTYTVWHADFDGSGLVDLTDFGNLAANFFKSGDTSCTPQLSPPLRITERGLNLNAGFTIQPSISLAGISNIGVPIGEEFEISLLAENTTDLYSYSLEVIYDSNGLELLPESGMVAREEQFLKQNEGNRLSLFIARQEDTGISKRVILAGSVTGQRTGVHGDGIVASLKFRVISDNPGTISLANVRTLDHSLKTNFLPGQKLSIQAVPKYDAILQNYPNPFNPETWIPYHLASAAEVSIRIYNVSGQLIRTIELGKQTAGYHVNRNRAAYWNGCNESGELASSGVYFYTIQAGDFVSTRKMILLK
jgi:hypothetical protein